MSLIFGYIDRSDRQEVASQRVLEALYEGISQFPHEQKSFITRENAAFGHALTLNTPEAVYERLPIYLPAERLLFVAQGRLDNRQELAAALGLSLHSQLPDGELMLKAYQQWGDDSADKLLGDWSLAVYDEKTDTLFMARDKLGYTALYYHFDGQRLVFSSSQKSILNLPGFTHVLNMRQFMQELILWDPSDSISHEQYYKGLFLLPPAHRLWFKEGQIRTERYWFPEKIQPQSGKTPAQYAQELNDIFTEAVRCRLRSHKPVASMLSGGLDSGSVATVAAELYREKGKRLTTFSHIPLYKDEVAQDQKGTKTNYSFDETNNILATARHAANIDPILLNSAQLGVVEGALKNIEIHDGLFHAIGNAYWLYDLPKQVQQQGFGTLLTGEMGNASISYVGQPYLLPLTHPALRRNWLRLIKQKIAKPLVLKYIHELYFKKDNLLEYVNNSYLSASLLDRMGTVADIKQKRTSLYKFYDTVAAEMMDLFVLGANPRCDFGANISHYFGIEMRDPTGDIRVIEYCLSIPTEAWISDSYEMKNILKLMMKDRLPDSVLFCKKKGLQSADLPYRIRAEALSIETFMESLSNNGRINEFFDMERLRQSLAYIRENPISSPLMAQTFIKNLLFAHFLSQHISIHLEMLSLKRGEGD